MARISAAWLLAATASAALSGTGNASLGTAPPGTAPARLTAPMRVQSPTPALARIKLTGAPADASAGSPPPLASNLDAALTAYDAGDFARARLRFRELADRGSAIAETMLGVIYERGQGVAADPATAAAYWLRAADRGYTPAQLALARALASGAGVRRDPGSAWMWASLAARGGDVAVAREAAALAAQLRRGFNAAQAAVLAEQLAGWRPVMPG